jgi:hypothetical protein
MGMFDNVRCRAMSCPGCGGDLDWQTKDTDCNLDTVYVVDVMRGRESMSMIGSCDECRWFVEATITRDSSPTVGQHLLYMAEKGRRVPSVDAAEFAGETGGTP